MLLMGFVLLSELSSTGTENMTAITLSAKQEWLQSSE